MNELSDALGKLAIPLSVASALFAGSAWITTLHNKVDDLSDTVKAVVVDQRAGREADVIQDTSLARMEGKLDLIINHLSNWGVHVKKNSVPSSNFPR